MVSYHFFVLVWGKEFVRKFVEVTLPFQLTPGNLPGLGQTARMTYWIYTDRASEAAFRPEIHALEDMAEVEFRHLEEITAGDEPLLEAVGGLEPPELKYEIQKHCLRHLIERLPMDGSAALVILDSNLILGDGTLRAMGLRRDQGKKAVTVSFLRLSEERALPGLRRLMADGGAGTGPRQIMPIALAGLHRAAREFFVDAPCFTPYPSQLFWSVGAGGALAHSFIPHPLMVTVTPPIRHFQSTADYDMALRACPDEALYLCPDSDEMLVCKISSDAHMFERPAGPPPSPENLALFALTATHHRHRALARQSVRFHADDLDESWIPAERQADQLMTAIDDRISAISANAGRLDARFLMHLKSHLGPIEDYMSPGLEPSALAHLATPNR